MFLPWQPPPIELQGRLCHCRFERIANGAFFRDQLAANFHEFEPELLKAITKGISEAVGNDSNQECRKSWGIAAKV